MANPYLSLTALASLESLKDVNQMMVIVAPEDENSQGTDTTVGYVSLSDFRDEYLLLTVNEQIEELQARPIGGTFTSPVTMTVTGAVVGSTSFDGSENFGLNLTMPDNSIPISAVEDLASTIAMLQSDAGQPDLLASSYYSNLNATTQTSVLGYWDSNTNNLGANDTSGVIMGLASDGNPYPSASSSISQLLFGNAGQLTWRRNVNNSGWAQVTLWHSGNFNPSNYAQLNTAATFGSISIAGTGSTGAALLYQDNDGADLAFRAGASGAYVYMSLLESGSLQINSGDLSLVEGGISIATGYGILWSSGGSIYAGSFDGSLAAQAAEGASEIFVLKNSTGANMVTWDQSGNQTNSGGITSSGAIQGATVAATEYAAVGGPVAITGTNAVLDIVTSSGHLIFGATNGASSIGSVNAAANAFLAMNFNATAYNFTGGSVNVTSGNINLTGSMGITGLLTASGGLSAPFAVFASTTGEVDVTFRSGNSPAYGTYFYNNTSGQAGFARTDASGGYAGSVVYWDRQTGNANFGASLSIAGTVTSTGVASFNTSDRRLKTNLVKATAQPFHRKAPLFDYDRIDVQAHGRSPTAQAVQAIAPHYVTTYDHTVSHTSSAKAPKTVKRLALDKAGVALEQAYWASHEVDTLWAVIEALQQDIQALKKLHKRTSR